MELLIGMLIGAVLAVVGYLFGQRKPPPPSSDAEASKERVKVIEDEAEAERERIREEIANESIESVVSHFFNVFSDPPPRRGRD